MTTIIADEVLDVLASIRCNGTHASMAHLGSLDRKLYAKVNQVLEALGGKWQRSAKAHVFDEDAANLIENAVLTGTYQRTKQDLGQFDTSRELAAVVIGYAGGDDLVGRRVLEPSAGIGNLACLAVAFGANVDAIEIDPRRAGEIRDRFSRSCGADGSTVSVGDFLTHAPLHFQYDAVIMNPPFANQADIDHVLHASRWLRPGGRLVSIMSQGVQFRTNKKAEDFRAWVREHEGRFHPVDDGAFAQAGTMVRVCILVVDL